MNDPEGVQSDPIEAAARYVLDNSRRGTASLSQEQFDADTEKLMGAYRDILRKAVASGHLSLTTPADPVAPIERYAAVVMHELSEAKAEIARLQDIVVTYGDRQRMGTVHRMDWQQAIDRAFEREN